MVLTSRQRNNILPYTFGNEIEYLQNLAKTLHNGAKTVVLGAGPGIMSLALFEGNPTLNIIAVDNNPTVIKTYEAHLHAAGFSSYVVCGDTVGVLSMVENDFPDKSVSLLIIDADHSYEAVCRDFYAWFDKVVIDGLILFHDFKDLEQNGTNGVERAVISIGVSAYGDRLEVVDTPGISFVVRKTR